VLGAVILDRRALTMRNLAFAVIAVVMIEPEAITGVSFQLSFAAVAALVAVMEARLAGITADPDPWLPRRDTAPRGLFLDLARTPLALLFATACATSATASFMAYHFHDLSPYVLIGNPLTLSVIEFFAVPGALLGAALYPLGLDAPVWLYVGVGIKFILWAARQLAALPGATLHLPAFAPFALPFLALAVMSVTIWRTWLFRASAIPLALIGLIGATHGARYDVMIAPSGDEAAVRDADGRLMIVGKRFNAFAAEQWLAADGDERDPASARDPDAPCDRLGCVAPLPEGESLSIVVDRLAFDEDCERAEVIVSALDAPPGCKAKFVLDAKALARLGAVGLTWDDEQGFAMTSDRSPLLNRPWWPALAAPHDRRIVRPGHATSHGPDPADPDDAPGDGR
jgi:competence protein ComEC